MDKIRLLVASEDSSSMRGLGAIFASESSFNMLGSFSLSEVAERAGQLQPDALVLDLPSDISKCKAIIQQLRNECPCSLILALIKSEQQEEITGLLKLGVNGCAPRGITRGCLVEAVELACWVGLFCLPSSIKKQISAIGADGAVNYGKMKNDKLVVEDILTRREMEILQLMAKNYSNREIANELYISEPTVKTHVSSILRKLGQDNRAQAIIYSYKHGLINDYLGLTK